MKQGPAFQFYAQDFRSDGKVILMTNAERGMYVMLLAYAWDENGLPTALADLARIVGEPVEILAAAWKGHLGKCFEERDGRFVQNRMEEVRAEHIAFREQQSRAGTAGARKRKANRNQATLTAGTKRPLHPESSDPYSRNARVACAESQAEAQPESSSPSPSPSPSDTTYPQDAREDDEPKSDAESEPAKSAEVDRSTFPAKDFARAFAEAGFSAGLVDQHLGFPEARSRLVNAWAQDCAEIIAAYGLVECLARSERFFAACRAGTIRKRPVTMALFVSAWSWECVATPLPRVANVTPIRSKSVAQIIAEAEA